MGEILVSVWTQILLLGGLLLLGIRLVPLPALLGTAGPADLDLHENLAPGQLARKFVAGPLLVAAGVALLTALYGWVPVGQPKAGRIMFVERHSTWEPTVEPYGTKVYGEAGSYNYAAAYAFCAVLRRVAPVGNGLTG